MKTKLNESLLNNCEQGDLEGIQYCIIAGADINYQSEEKFYTPIYHAANSGNRDAVKFLIDNHALVDEISIIEFVSRKDKEMVALLLTGDLGDLNLGVVFACLSSDMHEYPDENKFREISGLIINTLRHLLYVAYLTKQIVNDPDFCSCSIDDEID
jgi:ankyrin repeat protein